MATGRRPTSPAELAEKILRQGAQGAQTRAVRRATKTAVQIAKKAGTKSS